MADAPPGGAAKLDPQAAIAKQAAITQSGAAGDAATIARVENAISHSAMGWLQSMMGEVDARGASEKGQVSGKLEEHKSLVSTNSKDAPKDAGPPPAPGVAVHPAVPHPTAAGPAPAVHPATATGGAAPAHPAVSTAHPAKAGAAPQAAPPAPTIAAAVAGANSDPQLDAILNGYTPKSQQSTQMLGRIKQMGDIAQGFNGQLDVYVAQGGAVEHGIAAVSNFFGMGKDVSAVWANNPYRKVGGILGGIMTGLSAVKNVCGVVGSICGKLGLVLTVIGLLGMIFPPIGVAVSGIARILNVVGVICDAISFVLSGILTGLNGVVLAKQISAGASAEEKAATADLMMSEANEAASGFVNMAMIFGPKFMKGLLGNSKGVVASLMRRAKATIGRVSLKITGDVKMFANKIVRKLGFGGASMSRVGGAWKDTGFIARTKDKLKESTMGKAFYGAPQHIEGIQEKLMAKYGNTGWAKKLDRVGAWSGSVANKFDLEEKVGKMGENAGKRVGRIGENTAFGKKLAAAADRSEHETRELAMKMEARDAAHLEEERWKRYLNDRQKANPEHLRDKGTEQAFVKAQGNKVHTEAEAKFEKSEAQLESKKHLEEMRTQRFERKNEEFYKNETDPRTGMSARDEMMDGVHHTREQRYALEAQYQAQETERKALVGKSTKTAEEQSRLAALNAELKPLDEQRRLNKMYETELSGIASGSERARKPEYNNWSDVGSNVGDAVLPVAEMLHLKEQDSAWALAEKSSLKKQTKYSKGSAQGNAAGRGGHSTFEEIASEQRHDEMKDFGAFVKQNQHTTPVAGTVRSMLSGITGRGKAQQGPAPAPTQVAAQTATPGPSPTPTPTPSSTPTPVVASAPTAVSAPTQGGPGGVVAPTPTATATQEPDHAPGAQVAATAHAGPPQQEPDADGGEALPYWPAMLPEFEKAGHDFDWMRRVGVEFKKAQIEGKQKAVDTLAVYGRYQEYAKLRAASAQQNQAGAHATSQDTAQNMDHAGKTQAQAGQGEQKQGEAKGAANDKAATDLPEPESRGFWDRILGAVKRWAKNKAAQVFGWIQEKIASVVLKGLCGVSMGDMREYAGALRRQQASAHGVADNAGKTSGQVQQTTIKLGSDATKEAQGAADAIGECDRNITDADGFMNDITSFEAQLAEEKAHAQVFIAQVHAASHSEQARRQQEQEHAAQEEQKEAARANALGQDTHEATPTAGPAPAPTPTATPDGGPAPVPASTEGDAPPPQANPEGENDVRELRGAATFVSTEAESMVSRVETRSEDYQNQLALALTNHTGKDAGGTDLKGPSKKESKHIVEEFKASAEHTKQDMDGFQNMSIDPSETKRIADTIIQAAEHLEQSFAQSQQALDELFDRTYSGIRDGKRTLKSQVFDGNNVVGELNQAGNNAENKVIDTALPAANTAWNQVSAPIQPAAAPAATGPAPTS